MLLDPVFSNRIKYFLLVLFLVSSCKENEEIIENEEAFLEQEPIVLLIKNRRDVYADEVSVQVAKALDYSKVPYQTYDLGIISGGFTIPRSVRVIVNTSYLLHEIEQADIDKLIEFTARGGHLVFVGPLAYDEFRYLQGFKPDSEFIPALGKVGYRVIHDFFPNQTDRELIFPFSDPHDGYSVENFREDVNIHVTAASDTTYPVIISNKIGLGEVITINSTSLEEKNHRGIIFSSIVKGLKGIPYSIANVGTIFLDDFPAPLYNEKIEPIASEYDVEQAEFVVNIWWPEMKALADSLNMDYSAMTAFNYNANVVPPFDFREWESGKLLRDGKEVDGSILVAQDVAQSRHEMAFHGYNHFSLWLKDWDNINFMAAALHSSRKRWRIDDLGPLPVSYVPPTNYIDSVGIQALAKGMPSIRILSSLYLGNTEDGGNREFGMDPYSERFFNYPRISSGFTMSDETIFNQHGMQITTGIWNHFIHPDDVFQISQRKEDSFKSRNPLGLGWRKTSEEQNYGLYHVFVERLNYTLSNYPLLRFVTAEDGAAIAQDWVNKWARYDLNEKLYTIKTKYASNYELKHSKPENNQWFLYADLADVDSVFSHLLNQVNRIEKSKYWDGALIQFHTFKDSISVPNLAPGFRTDVEKLNLIVQQVFKEYRSYQTPSEDEFFAVDRPDTRYQDAIRQYLANPSSIEVQEQLIDLAIEFQEVTRAISILENRILRISDWKDEDQSKLITYYGWENLPERAVNYAEKIWERYKNKKVIAFKDSLQANLDVYSEAFARRWYEREVMLQPNNEALVLAYLRSFENAESWPSIKRELLRLIKNNSKSDSLYIYTQQRSFFYDSLKASIELLEQFSDFSHEQLTPLAENIANIYGYELKQYDKALYWAQKAQHFPIQAQLDWIAQKKDFDSFYALTKKHLGNSPQDDSIRVFSGTILFYQGHKEKGYEIMYPLFGKEKKRITDAHQLIDTEISFMSLEDRLDLFSAYPNYFSNKERTRLEQNYRSQRGLKGSVFGESYTDNFDNNSFRGGISVQSGNRRNRTHLFKFEDIYASSSINNQVISSNFTGLGYEFENRTLDYRWIFKAGGGLFAGTDGLIGELSTTLSYSYDSTFTSGELSLEPVLTQAGIDENIYKSQLSVYRENFWAKDLLVATFSGSVKYYTNSVFEYDGTGRLYLQPGNKEFRLRAITELYYADASETFQSGVPFFTPENLFIQGVGTDIRYREPNNFDYLTLAELEIMGKHETTDGFFVTGRASIETKLKSFWEFRLGTEISTSEVYRSNRIFFTISHIFNRRIIQKQGH